MIDEWYRDPEAQQMRQDIQQAISTAKTAANTISTHELVCLERYKSILTGQKVICFLLVLLFMVSFLGPHDGILSALHAVSK